MRREVDHIEAVIMIVGKVAELFTFRPEALTISGDILTRTYVRLPNPAGGSMLLKRLAIAASALALVVTAATAAAARPAPPTRTTVSASPRRWPRSPTRPHRPGDVREPRVLADHRQLQRPLHQLAGRQGANFTQSYAITHPSQPNYLALFSGSTQGVTDDACPHDVQRQANLGSPADRRRQDVQGLLRDACRRDGYTGCSSGNYARKHNPWVDFSNVPAASNLTLRAASRPNYPTLPTVSFVDPEPVQRHARLLGLHR